MTYKVTAPLVLAVDKEGHTHHIYQGGVIEWLSEAQEQHFLAEGLAVKVEGSDAPTAPVSDPEVVEVNVGEDGKPLRASTKPALVKWLSENQSDYSAEELNAMHKDDLWALIDAK